MAIMKLKELAKICLAIATILILRVVEIEN